ncbi:WRKY transcription factor 18-like [Prosopis cineraria]|uniref:WRKY transcription factor 18-like n=1 Tax=Prosopis cineraria TaxID=364024 RepID=UPI00240FDDCD|nr:WRKY transcription factor 18-like [Prosopis cineraria]
MEPRCENTFLNLNVNPSPHADGVPPEVLMMEELHRLNSEKKMLTEKLSRVNKSYSALQNHFNQVLKTTNSQLDLSVVQSRKRKAENENCIATNNMFSFSGASECSTSTEDSFRRPKDPSPISHPISPKVSKVVVRTQASDPSLYVRDGYQWRKYGQKVTRDNASPRAYFRCSFAPSCPVKKKVQKSAEDPTLLVATYEGEHNHIVQGAQSEVMDPIHPAKSSTAIADQDFIHQFLAQQMASSLARDPDFTSALAAAISGKILERTVP